MSCTNKFDEINGKCGGGTPTNAATVPQDWQRQLDAEIRDNLGVDPDLPEKPFGFIEPEQYRIAFQSGNPIEKIAGDIAQSLIDDGWTY